MTKTTCVEVRMYRLLCTSAKWPAIKRKQKKRNYLHQADIAEDDGRSRLQVEIPTDRYRKHLEAEGREKRPAQQETKVTISKRRVWVQVRCYPAVTNARGKSFPGPAAV